MVPAGLVLVGGEGGRKGDVPIPPHMARMATLVSWVLKAIEVSVQVVPVTSLPETIWAGIAAVREVERAARMMDDMYMAVLVSSFRKVVGI